MFLVRMSFTVYFICIIRSVKQINNGEYFNNFS